MSDQISGFVTSVESSRQGVIATSWVGDQMTVWNAADIDRSGCDLTPDDGVTIHRCTGVVTDGDESDIITMDSQPPADWPTGGTDEDGQDIPAEVRLDLWPEVLDVVAMVDPGDGEVLPVVVPHALRPLLAEGLRDSEEMEQVICSRQGTGWVVDDVLGLRAQVGMDGLSDAVQVAITSANGKTTITHSTTSPDADGVVAGDTWMQHDGSLSAPVVGMWSWDGAQWVASELSGAVLAAIDAGTITTGALSGITIFVPSPTALPRIEIEGSTIRIVRDAGDGTGTVTTTLGGEIGDQLQLYRGDGTLIAGMSSDGTVTGTSVQADEVLVSGDSVTDLIDRMPRGYVAVHRFVADTASVSTTEAMLVDLQFTAEPGRLYRVSLNSGVQVLKGGRSIAEYRLSVGNAGDSTVRRPTITDPKLDDGIFTPAAADGFPTSAFYGLWPKPSDGVTLTGPTPVRVGLTLRTESATGTVKIPRGTGQFAVEDMGTMYGGGFKDGNFGATPVVTTTRYFAPSWIRVWKNGVGQGGVQTAQQGYATRALGVGHGAGQWITMVGFPQELRDFINGAQTISDFSIWMNCYDTMNRGFTPRMSSHGYSVVPSDDNPHANNDDWDAPRLARGATRWQAIPWTKADFATTKMGVTFGNHLGTDVEYAGCFSITDGAPDGAGIRVTVTK